MSECSPVIYPSSEVPEDVSSVVGEVVDVVALPDPPQAIALIEMMLSNPMTIKYFINFSFAPLGIMT